MRLNPLILATSADRSPCDSYWDDWVRTRVFPTRSESNIATTVAQLQTLIFGALIFYLSLVCSIFPSNTPSLQYYNERLMYFEGFIALNFISNLFGLSWIVYGSVPPTTTERNTYVWNVLHWRAFLHLDSRVAVSWLSNIYPERLLQREG